LTLLAVLAVLQNENAITSNKNKNSLRGGGFPVWALQNMKGISLSFF
jgi:hypothetical protein